MYYGTNVPVFVQAEEVEAVRDSTYTVSEWAKVPDPQLRGVRGDEVIAEDVRLLSTPSHTRGHQSVVVDANDVVVVIAAQCAGTLTSSPARKPARRTLTLMTSERQLSRRFVG